MLPPLITKSTKKIMKNKNNFAFRFVEAMEAKSMTQGEIAKKLGTSKSLVSNWANNKTVPALKNCKKLSKLLSVSIEYLLTGIEEFDINEKYDDNSTTYSKGEELMMSDTQKQLGYIIENGSEEDVEMLMGKIGRIFSDIKTKKRTRSLKK